MINVEINEKKSQSKAQRSNEIKPFPVRTDQVVANYLKRVYNKSQFINKALHFYIMMINNPKEILKELKRRDPTLYKYVGRRKF